MQLSSKLLFKTAVVLLGMLLAMGIYVALSSQTQQASALSTSDWTIVKTAVNAYIANQDGGGLEGEEGFRMTQAQLKGRIDSNGDGETSPTTKYLGEGDNAVNAPVLVDNLYSTANVIPGTSVRCNWSGAAATTSSCMNADRVSAVKTRVDAHASAGFSTDVVVYCATGRTEAPVTGGFGAIANTSGGLGTSTTPNVYGFTWGRNGWTNTSTFANTTVDRTTGTTALPITTYSVSSSALPDCSAESTDAGRVRCAAAWALDTAGGNVSNGVNPLAGSSFGTNDDGPLIDIRSGNPESVSTMISTSNVETPIAYDTLFNTGLPYLDVQTSTSKNVFASRTSQLGGIAAMGARMLGYNATFLREGSSGWDKDYAGTWASTGVAYSTIAATGSDVNSGIDQTPPTITTAPSASSITTSSADISRVASEPATMKVEYGTTSGGPYTSTENNTVLNASKTVSLSGLSPSTTYYVKVTSYDGQANGTASSEISFTTATACTPGQPSLSLAAPVPFWASWGDYVAKQVSVTWTVNNTGATDASNVAITGSTPTYPPVTLITAMPASLGNIAASGSASTVLKYQLPVGFAGAGFHVINTGSAEDCAANSYTYP